jgi:hypothetical protein
MTQFYNAFHAPLGAHSSFTLGCLGRSGGLGLELGGPANESVFIGLETRGGGSYEALPFYAGAENDAERYDHANTNRTQPAQAPLLSPVRHATIRRQLDLGTDRWSAGDLTFTVYSLAEGIPEPGSAPASLLRKLLCPAVIAELTIDNTRCKRERRAFFGYTASGHTDSIRIVRAPGQVRGVAAGRATGIFSDDPALQPALGFAPQQILREKHPENYSQHLGNTGLLLCPVPAGEKKTFRFAICFFRGGEVTTGMPCSYYYTRYFRDISAVARTALTHFAWFKDHARKADQWIQAKGLNPSQRFMMAHAIRSYYGSTQLLQHRRKPVWVVNEGEYRMMNTFDLTVDQLFFEMKLNPWTVRNELDLFTRRYSYRDKTHIPGGPNRQPGGLSFTHDMGVRNHFTAPGYSSYERTGLTGCFSYMTHEQLVNWILCAAVYAKGSKDLRWVRRNLPVLRQCLTSMLNRDNPDPSARNGIMGLDSSRTGNGAEITTYDSLDTSLGQSRNNVYLAVKSWAAYLAMAALFKRHGLSSEASTALDQAARAAATVASHLNRDGYIPAVLGEACDSRIIPAIEGLVFPWVLGDQAALREDGPYGPLIKALRHHFRTILKKGVCLYADGGWKLSSSADNSWLSKIYLCQFVARRILGFDNPATRATADRAHHAWLLKSENLPFAWSDQMSSGIAKGSKYYPRGVTSVLWLEETR